jgi:uncharacterized membrane protein
MAFFDLFGKKQVFSGPGPYALSCEIHPMRLPAHRNEFLDLEITVTNIAGQELLTSVVVVVPKTLGFEQTALNNEREIRLGMLQPRETRDLKVRVWGTQRTEAGTYPIKVFALSHYRDYGHVLNQVRRALELRVV